MHAVRNDGYDSSAANTVAQIATQFYGNEHMFVEIHNALRERYTNYLDVYNVVKTVLSKYADAVSSNSKTSIVTAKDKTEINTQIMKLLSKAGYSNDIVAYVASTVVRNLGFKDGKQQTYKIIISKYGQSRGLLIYNQIRKHI